MDSLEKIKAQEIILDPKHWDCECLKNYIHCRSLKRCDKCGVVQPSPEAPDARLNEVEEILGKDHKC